MPVARAATEAKIINAAMKRADALIARTDKNKDGKLDEPELKKLMASVERMTKKLEDAGEDGSDPAALLKSKMTDRDRTLMATMQGISAFADAHSGLDIVPTKDASAAVRKHYESGFEFMKNNPGGIEGALGMMMYAMMMPKAALPLIAQAIAAHSDP
jgi:hypothetical protein